MSSACTSRRSVSASRTSGCSPSISCKESPTARTPLRSSSPRKPSVFSKPTPGPAMFANSRISSGGLPRSIPR
ncbi:MAG: hypothetical protein ACK55Z_15545, partial [bacterium]